LVCSFILRFFFLTNPINLVNIKDIHPCVYIVKIIMGKKFSSLTLAY
jgi:hypothetical protein